MSREQNIGATKRFGELVNTGTLDGFAEVVSPDCVDHDPAPGQGPGPLGFTSFFTTMRAAFPDLNIAVEHLLADDDNVSFAYTITGTHQGVFMGVPPTGKSIKVRGMQIGRFENGLMVERWGSSDELGMLSQLGIDLPGRG
ncbi:ester cyclase [Deinococcus sp. UYEF24]